MTRAELRKSGVEALADLPWGTHFCHFYETDEEIVEISIPYLKAGLDGEEFCVWTIAEPLTERKAWNALRRAIPDLDRHRAGGNIEVLSSRDFYLDDGVLDRERAIRGWQEKLARALDRGHRGMRITGGTRWVPSAQWGELCAYEQALNEAFLDRPLTVLCAYPLDGAASDVLDVARTHQFATSRRQGRWDVIETPVLRQAKPAITRLNEALERQMVERTRPGPASVDAGTTTGDMVAAIVHEANQPLAAVLTNASVCRRSLGGAHPDLDGARAAMDRILEDGRRTAEMMQRIRALVKRNEPEKARLDLNDVIREAVAHAETEMRRHGVSPRTELSGLPLILGDRAQLREVIRQLILNALEAMSAADAAVGVPRELVIASRRAGTETVLVEVRDSGIGFEPDCIPRLFDPCFTTKPGSMGMGLSISRSIIDVHDGRLWATPNADHGATLRFTLPIARDVSPA